ncbi:MAG: HD domain-containing phosphohydrolase [Candidatus Zixiibacteriota bacterium]
MTADSTIRVLFVDDDRNFLDAVVRQFRNRFDLVAAEGGTEGLQAMRTQSPFQVVVSDMRMPDMNGIQFLARAREINPDTVRIMLTGNAELDTAMHAVNEGNIFRFLVKPCQKATMEWAIEAGVEQYRLITAERELLEKTLKGSVQVLADTLALVSPLAFSRASRIKEYVSQVAKQLAVEKAWEFELAALLSQIGCVTIPPDILEKVYSGTELTEDEVKMYQSHPEFGGKLIALIPRLQDVSLMIARQMEDFKDCGVAAEDLMSDRIALGSQMLKICTEFDLLTLTGQLHGHVIGNLKMRSTEFSTLLAKSLEQVEVVAVETELREISIRDLTDSMTLAQDLKTRAGLLVAPKGQKASLSLRVRLENYLHRKEIDQKVRVNVAAVKQASVHRTIEASIG